MADELIDIFDENNKPLRIRKMKSEAHKKGLWHRASHVWIYNSNGDMLLQLRARDKDMDPDRWDIAAAGHVGAGENPLSAALRETEEELCLTIKATDLEFVKIRVRHNVFNGLVNNEFQYAYFLKFDGDIDSLKIQEEEVQAIQFISIKQIQQELQTKPDKYVSHKEYWVEILNELNTRLGLS